MIRRHGFLVGLLVLAQVFVLTFASLAATGRWLSMPLGGDEYVLLVLGSDTGPPRGGSATGGRADAIHLVVVDEARTHVSIVNIPRDSYVPVRGMGRTKINAMLTRGPENAVRTVEDLTGLDVDDWMVSGFDAFSRAIDEFGPVKVNVEQRLYDPQGAHSDLQPGTQRLNGTQALAYSRDRKSRPGGDFGRTAAQGKMLQAMHRDLIRRSASPTSLLEHAATLRSSTASSIGPDRLLRLGTLALRIDPSNVAHETAPGSAGRAGSASVVYLSDGAYALFAELRQNGRLPELE